MKKSDLKTGMIIETDDGRQGKVLLNTSRGDVIGGDGKLCRRWCDLSDYREDLTCINYPKTNIVKIWDGDFNDNGASIKYKGELLWEREEVKKMTVKEIQDKLGYKIEIVE